jgi:hypothetical protein
VKELLLQGGVPGRLSSYYVGAEFYDRVDCSDIIDFHVFPRCIQCANCHLIIGSYFSYQVDSEFIRLFCELLCVCLGRVMFKFLSELPRSASFFIWLFRRHLPQKPRITKVIGSEMA